MHHGPLINTATNQIYEDCDCKNDGEDAAGSKGAGFARRDGAATGIPTANFKEIRAVVRRADEALTDEANDVSQRRGGVHSSDEEPGASCVELAEGQRGQRLRIVGNAVQNAFRLG